METLTAKELLKQTAVKERLSDSLDSGYTTEEMIAYLNDALDFVWHVLLRNGYYECIGDLTLTQEETPLPDDYYKSTNQAPVYVKGNKLVCYGALPYTYRYYKEMRFVKTENDELPLTNDGLLDIVTQILIIMAMSNHGFDMQMESDFVQAITNLL